LIHNPQTLELLRKKNVEILTDPCECNGNIVVIRAHGISPEKLTMLQNAGTEIRDATCPRVKRVQEIVRKASAQGRAVIIIGDRGHAEVEGLQGFAGPRCVVIEQEDEVPSLPPLDRVTVVAQTTMDTLRYETIAARLRQRYPDCEIHDTICDSTRKRQQEILELGSKTDAFIVVGGTESANTARLATIAASLGKPSFHIETEKELDAIDFSHFRSVTVTAGASTPNWMINRVLDRLYEIRREQTKGPAGLLQWIFRFSIRSNLYVAIGSGIFSLACALVMKLDARPLFFLATSLYVFSIHILNHFTDIRAMEINEPARHIFYKKHQKSLIAAAVIASVGSLTSAAFLGFLPFIILLVATSTGVAYSVRFFPPAIFAALGYRRLRDVPGSKEILVALAWATVISLVPSAASPGKTPLAGVTVVFLYSGALAFIRTVSYSLKDIQGDRILGNETIPVIIGEKKARRVGTLLGVFLVFLIAGAYLLGLISGLGLLLLPVVPYAVYFLNQSSRLVGKSVLADTLIDAVFYITGVLALVWSVLRT
jgi:4-hydroxy-3-methylbut-2-enyl diphosphate reductase